ncbi:MAG: hypothetical protein M3Z54_02610 [Gemmatimonadota bacterium]|nr:hypothetical protein [Gemmatimonadota bacterium]
MPQRSNHFQRVVLAIHVQLADGCRVSQSRMLRDRTTGLDREVDVVIESEAASYPVVIAVECFGRSRSATVESVEQTSAKHDTLPTSKLILVAQAGFTKAAKAKAALLGIEVLSLDKAEKVDWTSVVHRLHQLIICAVRARTFVYGIGLAGDDQLFELSHDAVLEKGDGIQRLTVGDVIDSLLFLQSIRMKTLEVGADAPDGKTGWLIELPLPRDIFAVVDGERRRVASLRFAILTDRVLIDVELTAAAFRNAWVAYGEAVSPAGNITVSVLERRGVPPTAAIVYEDEELSLRPLPLEVMRRISPRASTSTMIVTPHSR